MKAQTILILLTILSLTHSLNKYDFNACRIANCNAEELNCISDSTGCLNYFATMRNW